jgi:hypothetical protein
MPIHYPVTPSIPSTILVVARQRDIPEARYKFPHWAVIAVGDCKTGARFDRVLLAHNVTINCAPAFETWFHHFRTCLKPGGTLKRLSRIDTITDMC